MSGLNYEEKRQLYGADAAEWLRRWDEGKTVWSIEMGGLGPGYEQCLQIAAVEIVRHLLNSTYQMARWRDKDSAEWQRDRELIHTTMRTNPIMQKLGLSGAQYAGALSLAIRLVADGPAAIMDTPDLQDRKIQIDRNFPSV